MHVRMEKKNIIVPKKGRHKKHIPATRITPDHREAYLQPIMGELMQCFLIHKGLVRQVIDVNKFYFLKSIASNDLGGPLDNIMGGRPRASGLLLASKPQSRSPFLQNYVLTRRLAWRYGVCMYVYMSMLTDR